MAWQVIESLDMLPFDIEPDDDICAYAGAAIIMAVAHAANIKTFIECSLSVYWRQRCRDICCTLRRA
ncbi:MAG TPA: hypothetical protein VH000_08590, partial [Rhizomicrobium sp.]|nr:hypothetical protein [Rhizomicrobium sp.]